MKTCMKRVCWLLLAALIAFSAMPSVLFAADAPTEYIFDNKTNAAEIGKSPDDTNFVYWETGGPWATSSNANYVLVNDNNSGSRYLVGVAAPLTAGWRIYDIPPGAYYLFFANVNFGVADDMLTTGKIDVMQGGTLQEDVMPIYGCATSKAHWVNLGVYEFTGDGSEYVQLRPGTTQPGMANYCRADAIKLVPAERYPAAISVNERELTTISEGSHTAQLTTTVTDITGETYTDLPAKWTMTTPAAGVTMTEDGLVTIDNTVAEGATFTVTCTALGTLGEPVETVTATQTITLVAPTVQSIQIVPPEGVITPPTGTKDYPITAVLVDQCGLTMPVAPGTLTWSLAAPVAGVVIGSETGVLTVAASVEEGTEAQIQAVVTGSDPVLSDTVSITIVRPVPASVEIVGEADGEDDGKDTVTILPDNNTEVTYRAVVRDADGTELPTETVVWTLEGSSSEANIEEDGTLILTSACKEAAFTITAASAKVPSATATLAVTAVREPPKTMQIRVTGGNASVTIPGRLSTLVSFDVELLDQYGTRSDSWDTVRWSMSGATAGCSLDDNGVLTVTSSASRGTITVQAVPESNPDLSASAQVSLKQSSSQTISGGGGGLGGGTIIGSRPTPTPKPAASAEPSASPSATPDMPSPAPSYSDVKPADWFYETVETVTDLGIINGYEDATFRPERQVTRGEFLKMLVCAMGVPLSDVAATDHWARVYAATAQENGYLSGFPGDVDAFLAQLDNPITRWEMAFLTMNSLVTDPVTKEPIADFDRPLEQDDSAYLGRITDLPADAPYRAYVLWSYAEGILTGYEDDTFRPDHPVTRAEAATVIVRRLDETQRVFA